MTSHGSLYLPETSRANLLSASREELYDRLRVGCSYSIVTAGYGQDIDEDAVVSNRGKRHLVSLEQNGACG